MTQEDRKIYHVCGLEEPILWKWLFYPKHFADSMQSLSKYQWHFSENSNRKILQCAWKPMTQIAKGIVRKKYGTGGIRLTDFRHFYKNTIRPIWYWPKDRNTDQWNSIESSEVSTHTYGYLTNDKGSKNIQWRKDSLLNKWCWENWTAICKRMKLEHSLTSYTKRNLKWIKDLNVRPDTMKLLEENTGKQSLT